MYDFLYKMYLFTEPNEFALSALPFVYLSVYLIHYIVHSLCSFVGHKQVCIREADANEASKSNFKSVTAHKSSSGRSVDPVWERLGDIMGVTSWTRKFVPSTLAILCSFQIIGVLSNAQYGTLGPYKRQSTNSSGLLDVFQASKPVFTPSAGSGYNGNCVTQVLLMDYVFGFSYGKPFIGIFNRTIFQE